MRTFFFIARLAGVTSLLGFGLSSLFGTGAQAACLPGGCHQNGLVFREASGDFRITDVAGAGTLEQPFVVYQDVWGFDISLEIDGLAEMSQHAIFGRPGLAISIVSRNLTDAFWRFYDHELQETVGISSSENDGLSFAQGLGPARPYTSDRYARADEVTDIRDFINFHQGAGVDADESVQFNYVVTDTIPNQSFYIRQRPDYRTNAVPTAALQQLAKLANVSVSEPVSPSAQVAEPQPQPGLTHVFQITNGAIASETVPEPTSLLALGSIGLFLPKLLGQNKKTSPSKS